MTEPEDHEDEKGEEYVYVGGIFVMVIVLLILGLYYVSTH